MNKLQSDFKSVISVDVSPCFFDVAILSSNTESKNSSLTVNLQAKAPPSLSSSPSDIFLLVLSTMVGNAQVLAIRYTLFSRGIVGYFDGIMKRNLS